MINTVDEHMDKLSNGRLLANTNNISTDSHCCSRLLGNSGQERNFFIPTNLLLDHKVSSTSILCWIMCRNTNWPPLASVLIRRRNVLTFKQYIKESSSSRREANAGREKVPVPEGSGVKLRLLKNPAAAKAYSAGTKWWRF